MGLTVQCELALHQKVLQGDSTAPAQIIQAFLPYITGTLRAKYPAQHDETAYVDAATDALFDYVQQPQKYDPGKARLGTYLVMAAKSNFITLTQKSRRISDKEVHAFNVEDGEGEENKEVDFADERITESKIIMRIEGQRAIRQFSKTLTPKDRKLFKLMLSGERDNSAYVTVLGIDDLSADEQRRVVKRHKDRIDKLIERFGESRARG